MEKLDPSKFHSLSPEKRKSLLTWTVVILLVVLPLFGYQYYKFAINRPAQGFRETTFEISEGEAISSISRRLYTESLVNSPFLFKLYLLINDSHTGIQAGVYTVPSGASIVELGGIFQHGTNDVRVTFVEGWRAEEISRLATEIFPKVDYDTLVRMARENEGYLFPDTYFFNIESTEEEVIERLTQTFEAKTADLLTEEDLAAVGLTEEQAVIFASIVEREVSNPEDRPIVAGILIKRFNNGELIGADATTQYAVANFRSCGTVTADFDNCPSEDEETSFVDWWPRELTQEDLDLDSPYNTRRVVGLPPAPVASPGLGAINAVINFRETVYNYYLTDLDGITHYAETLEEHISNAARYL